MDALEMTLLFDYYGSMLTQKQRECFDMRYNQDLSLSEIADALGVSRQAVCDNLSRTEALLRKMEQNIGCIRRSGENRKTLHAIAMQAKSLLPYPDPVVANTAQQILATVQQVEE